VKKCTNCAKDLPDAALHCVFCGSKQPPAPAGAQAKTVMGWQASDLLKDIQAKGGQVPAAQPKPPTAPPPMGGPPPAAPPPPSMGMAPTMVPSSAPPPSASAAGMQATLVPPSGPGPMGGGPAQMPPARGPNDAANQKTMMVQGPPLGHGPGPMGGGPAQMPPAAPPPGHASQAATMFVQGPPMGAPMGPGPGGPGGPPPPMGGGYGGPPPPMGGPPPPMGGPPPGGGYGGPPPPMGGPPMGGYPPAGPPGGGPAGYNPQPMGGYNPQPVGGYQQQPMQPPYLASRTAARAGAPVEPFKDGIKIVLIAMGVALLIAGAMPFKFDPDLKFRWDMLEGQDALGKFQLIYVSAAAILALVFGLVPLATVPRGALTAVLGLVPIVLAFVVKMKDAKEFRWQEITYFVSMLVLVPGLLLRHEYRSQMLPRILVTVGALCVLVMMLVPEHGGDPPIVGMFKMLGDAPGKAKVGVILKLVPFVLAVLSLLVWIPPPSSAGAKPIAWLWILISVYTAYTMLIVDGHIGDKLKAAPNATLMAPWEMAAWVAFIGYGIATIFGKNLEHS
jgi:hypothetical protein